MTTATGNSSFPRIGILATALLLVNGKVLIAAETTDKNHQQVLARQILEETGTQGGLVVHLGCGDGQLTAALRAADRYLVHGLDTSAENVRQARRHIQSSGLYGNVSVDRFDGKRLPYADNLVNLVVVSGRCQVAQEEIARVLVPNGVALVSAGVPTAAAFRHWPLVPRTLAGLPGWDAFVKPWPDTIDQWTHWMHSADGNAVAADRVVGPPRRIQWVAAPLWQRHHDTVPSTSAMVSARGRLFYICDEAPACLDGSLPDRWFLVARDGFNGVLLWKRPIHQWGWGQWAVEWKGRFNVPPHLPKRLVAAGDRVYATLNFNAPLSELDAATGEVLREYENTRYTDEILYLDGLLILSVNHEARTPSKDNKTPVHKSVCVVQADSGKMLWKAGSYTGLRAKYSSAEPFGRLELTVGGDQLFLADHDAIVSLDLKSGRQRWRIPRPQVDEHLVMYDIRMSDQSVMVYQDGVLLFAQPEMKKKRSWHTLPGTLHAYRAEDGSPVWQHPYGGWAHNWQPDVFVVDGLVWLHEHQDVPFPGHDPANKDEIDYALIGLDLKTGELKRRFSTKKAFNVGHHHRCYRGKATERFLIASRRGAEFLDLATEQNHLHHWARGACLHGFVPCNGLLYLCPHPCECYIATKLNGYYALAPEDESKSQKLEASNRGQPAGGRWEKGPAFGQVMTGKAEWETGQWPTFRADAKRSGSTATSLPSKLKQSWSIAVSNRLSPPVVAGEKVFVASIDEHRVAAFDAVDGKAVWSFATGGRVDTPPTLYRGLVLFGSADGWVYCLREADGQLAWRRRVAPGDRLVGAFGQLESAWPVHGSVLVQNHVAYLAAGRSSYLDGGIFLYALDPATGEILDRRTRYSPDPDNGEMPPGDARTVPGTLADILVGDGSSIYMRQQRVFGDDSTAGDHVFSTAGFRDASWFNRTRWAIGAVTYAQLLVFDDQMAYGVAAYPGGNRAHLFQPAGKGYLLFAGRWKPLASGKRDSGRRKGPERLWSIRLPVRVTAMALAGRKLLAAGPPDTVDPQDPLAAFEGRKGGKLWILSADDGSKLAEYDLPGAPVFDGMAVAGQRGGGYARTPYPATCGGGYLRMRYPATAMYVSTVTGELVCFAGDN